MHQPGTFVAAHENGKFLQLHGLPYDAAGRTAAQNNFHNNYVSRRRETN